ncbi:MAG TPA: helix-turn-helix transcriptional regulator [Pseudonocardiaceae bacterium]|jgi:DNA-binding XRE family transcriptional regulator|nr:helix-turn-helix transcriptional regulator [Pseudonocardiaceae bacterium]
MEHRTTAAAPTTAVRASDNPMTGRDSVAPAPRAPSPGPTPGDGPPDEARAAPLLFSPSRLRAWRHLRGTDHATLAHAAGTTSGDVAACEAGRQQPHMGMVTAWAAVLGCQPDQLHSTTPEGPDEYWQAA